MSNLSSSSTNKFFNFTGQIGDLAHRNIDVVRADCSIEKASKYFLKPHIDYLVMMEKGVPVGTVSKADFIENSLKDTNASKNLVRDIMNSQVVSVERSDSVFESLMFMVKHKLDYLLIMDGKKAYGIVTQNDWLSAETKYPLKSVKRIEAATSVEELTQLRKDISKLVYKNLHEEGTASSLTSIITVTNDAITKRIIQLSLDYMQQNNRGIPPVSFAWIGMGSEGRKAQTTKTDQDNGLIFENVPEKEYQSVKNWFLEFAEKTCQSLKICGFPLCEGNIMATNPELCNSLDKWEELFERIVTKSDAKELLESSIYFDFRSIYGNKVLAKELWIRLSKLIKTNSFFIRHLAQNMLEASRPPIRHWRWHAPRVLKIKPTPFDIKRRAIAPLDAALRLMALEQGISNTNTLERLSLLLEKGQMPKTLADDTKKAFNFVLRLRFRMEFNQPEENNLDPILIIDTLIPIQVRNLKVSLETIYKLQDYAYKQITHHKVPWAMR